VNLEITGSKAVAGEGYELQCSLMGIDQSYINTGEFQWTWIGPSQNAITTESHNGIIISMTSNNFYQCNLQFHRLNNSAHSGNYICQVRIGNTTINDSYHLQINSKTATCNYNTGIARYNCY
jgi:hypothetical protein